MEWCGNPKDGHDDSLVFFVDEDLHVSDVFFSGHLGDVFIGDVGFSGPAETNSLTRCSVAPEMAVHAKGAHFWICCSPFCSVRRRLASSFK